MPDRRWFNFRLSGKRSSLRTVTFDSDASQGVDAAAPGDNSKVWTSGPLFRTLSDSRVSSTSIDGLTLPTAGDGWLDLGFQRAALMGSVGQAEGGIARTISAPPLQASAELEIQELDDYMDKEAILGGELVIRIYGAENIAAVGRWKTIVRKSLTIRDCTERNDRPAERAEVGLAFLDLDSLQAGAATDRELCGRLVRVDSERRRRHQRQQTRAAMQGTRRPRSRTRILRTSSPPPTNGSRSDDLTALTSCCLPHAFSFHPPGDLSSLLTMSGPFATGSRARNVRRT